MLRRERRLVPAVRDFYRYVVRSEAPSPAHRDAALDGFLWTVLSPGGTATAVGVGFLALATALFSGWAAYETRRSADVSVKATQATVWLQLMTEYAEPRIRNAMSEMRQFQERNKEQTSDAFRGALLSVDETGETPKAVQELDTSRRIVSIYFHKVATLIEGDIIDNRMVKGALSASTFPFIRDVLNPLELGKQDAMLAQGRISKEDYQEGVAVTTRRLTLWRKLLVEQ